MQKRNKKRFSRSFCAVCARVLTAHGTAASLTMWASEKNKMLSLQGLVLVKESARNGLSCYATSASSSGQHPSARYVAHPYDGLGTNVTRDGACPPLAHENVHLRAGRRSLPRVKTPACLTFFFLSFLLSAYFVLGCTSCVWPLAVWILFQITTYRPVIRLQCVLVPAAEAIVILNFSVSFAVARIKEQANTSSVYSRFAVFHASSVLF